MRWLILLLLSGCSGTPYLALSAAYQIDDQTDYWLKSKQSWQCNKQPQFHGEIGLEFDNKLTVGYHHQSWLRCGGPFNHNPEVYQADIRVTKVWGGK